MGGVVVISADVIVATVTLLAAGGSCVKWVVARMDRQAAKFEGKMAKLETRYATLRIAFQMVSNELARRDPNNAILHRAQEILLRDYGDPIDDRVFDDLLQKIV